MTSPPIWTTTSCREKGQVSKVESIQSILSTVLLSLWVCVSAAFLVALVQGVIHDHRREKRERDRRDRLSK